MDSLGNSHPRNHGLDFLKGIAACFIVFVHVTFPKPFGLFVAYLGSFGVSVFFMTAGYFSVGASNAKLLHSVKRTFIYLLVAYVLYLFRLLVIEDFHIQPVMDFLVNEVFTWEHLLKTLVLSQSKICYVAWFLISLIMCYVLKMVLGKNLRYLGYLGLVAGIVVVLPPIGNDMDFPISNPWLWGVPFFVLGEMVHEHENKLNEALSRPVLVLLCLTGVAISLLSRYCGTQWWHIANMILAPALFVLFSNSGMKYNRFCLLGGTYAFFIYIIHPLVMFSYNALREHPGVAESWLRPFIVLAVTVLLAAVYYRIKSVLSARFRRE